MYYIDRFSKNNSKAARIKRIIKMNSDLTAAKPIQASDLEGMPLKRLTLIEQELRIRLGRKPRINYRY